MCLAASGVLVGVAGCTGDGGSSGTGGGDGPATVEEWLADTDNYDGIVDRTDTSAVTVEVGPDSNEMVFAPAAIRIRPGTTIGWEWVGSGRHNVIADGGSFDSGSPEQGATFEHTFDTTGTAFYYCEPHRSAGMKGAVVVADASDSETE